MASGNFATLNPSTAAYADLKEGNVRVTGTSASGNGYFQSTFGVSSGKWYAEMYVITIAFSHPSLGLTGGTQTRRLLSNEGMEPNLVWYGGNSSNKLAELSMDNDVWGTYSENESSVSTISATNVIMIALDADNKKLWYGNNGTWYNSGDPAANDGNWAQSWTTNPDSIHLSFGGYVNSDQVVNFGQDSTFGGRISAGGNADGNGFGDFKYAPPSGFLALCSANLPVSDDIDPAQTDDDFPQKQFNTVLFNGNGSTNAVTGLGFKPDLIWGFTRSAGQSKRMIDSTRGGSSRIYSDLSSAVDTSTATISAFGTDGFTATGGAFNNDNGATCGAWCWKAAGGTTASNSDGSITSTVQANTKSGFSIVTTTGTGSNATIGHGLGAVPKFILSKQLTGGSFSWVTYHPNQGADGLNGQLGYMHLDANSGFSDYNLIWNDTVPTSSVFSVGTAGNVNGGGSTYVHYVWAEVEGFSRFSSYVGNGNADGPFIYTGFRPRMLFFKRTSSGHNWITFDTATKTFNPNDEYANWDTGGASAQGASDKIDVLSNGFKIRSTGSSFNGNGADFIFGAWGDVPFKYNNSL